MDEFYFVYILKSIKDGKNYAGYTKNLKLRFEQHKNGEVKSTKYRRPLKLIYFEACLNQQDALKREKYFKTHYGKMYLKNRLANGNAEFQSNRISQG
jgi:putative endonuclease